MCRSLRMSLSATVPQVPTLREIHDMTGLGPEVSGGEMPRLSLQHAAAVATHNLSNQHDVAIYDANT